MIKNLFIGKKMEWIIAIAAAVIGAGSGSAITWATMRDRVSVVETNKVIEKMVEVDSSLTETDLLKVPCSQEYMEKNGEQLCREMFCRMNTRGGATQQTATSKECEAISNTINKAYVQKYCKNLTEKSDTTAQEYDLSFNKCVEFFDRRL